MGDCLDEIPSTCRAKGYDYCNSAYASIAVQSSGKIIIARGETLDTGTTVLAPNKSGGVVLASGPVDRVIIKVPDTIEYQDGLCKDWCNSGLLVGVWIGGASGTGEEPIPMSGSLISGKGLFISVGDQKELYVRDMQQIRVAGVGVSGLYPSMSGIYGSGIYHGFPVTYIGEVIRSGCQW